MHEDRGISSVEQNFLVPGRKQMTLLAISAFFFSHS